MQILKSFQIEFNENIIAEDESIQSFLNIRSITPSVGQ